VLLLPSALMDSNPSSPKDVTIARKTLMNTIGTNPFAERRAALTRATPALLAEAHLLGEL
jgi:hypothetical protein